MRKLYLTCLALLALFAFPAPIIQAQTGGGFPPTVKVTHLCSSNITGTTFTACLTYNIPGAGSYWFECFLNLYNGTAAGDGWQLRLDTGTAPGTLNEGMYTGNVNAAIVSGATAASSVAPLKFVTVDTVNNEDVIYLSTEQQFTGSGTFVISTASVVAGGTASTRGVCRITLIT
jgi:hypothetical protein